MEKCKKLSLKKRKVQATNESKMKLETKNTVGLFDDLLTSENDAERIEISVERTQKSTRDTERTAAHTDDPNLQKLRELMMKVSSREIENGKTLQPFPPYISDDHLLQNLQKQGFYKEKQLIATKFTVTNDELLPFPSLPAKFKQRKKQKLLEKYNSSAGSSISLVNQVEDNVPSKNLDTNGLTTLKSHGQSNLADFQKNERDMDILFDSDKRDLSEVGSRRNMDSPPPHNCHLIRDRNSNYYSLQSQNQKQPEQKCKIMANTATSTSTVHSSNLSAFTKSSAFIKSSAQIGEVENMGDKFDQCNDIATSKSTNKSKHVDLKTSASLYSSCVKSGASSKTELDRNNDGNDSLQFSPLEEDLFFPEKETKSDILQKCPLCQQEFPRNSTQMDVDGHIAKCFSNSEDDVLW